MRVAIIGCGLIGRKRALAVGADERLVACCDTDAEAAFKLADEFSCDPFQNHRALLRDTETEVVIVSVVNKFAREVVLDALACGKHVLVEKPLGRNVREAAEMAAHAATGSRAVQGEAPGRGDGSCVADHGSETSRPLLKVGFNHRFHPAIWKARAVCESGGIGRVFSIRARYGHGGRPGLEREWRASKDLCGGGELLDQGVHVIDLVRWFGGEIAEVYGRVETHFWPMEVEDNAYGIMKTTHDVTAAFHVGWTNWKNIFSFEIFGTEGYLRAEGLGGSYGRESLEFGRRRKAGGAPDIEHEVFPAEDVSWSEEWKAFLSAIRGTGAALGDAVDGLRAHEVVEALYASSETGRVVKTDEA
jgi:predicted dehydrogenase